MKRALRAALLVLAVAGCGSGSSHGVKLTNVPVNTSTTSNGNKTFSAKDMFVHFQFPDSFRVIPVGQSRHTAGTNSLEFKAAIGVSDFDLLAITRSPDAIANPLTQQTVAQVKPHFDALLTQVAGRPMVSKVRTIAGNFAFVWPRIPVTGLPVSASAQVSDVLDGRDEYELECQATPAKLTTIEAACAEMVRTLTFSK